MISKLYNYWHILKSSLWFLPAIFCFCYFLSVLALYEIETLYFPNLELPTIFFSGNSDDAKSVTITLLSSMITMATLAISITIVALSLAASQLGPRLIKVFMANRKTQTFIGLFFGAVIACFILTVILHDAGPKAINPQITINFVFTISFANLFVLLAFVHHVAQSIIADNVITSVAEDLMKAVSRLTRSRKKWVKNKGVSNEGITWPENFSSECNSLKLNKSGYIQNIDYDQIALYAEGNKAYVQINVRSGDFLVDGQKELNIMCTKDTDIEKLNHEICKSFIVGNNRTPTQDIEYSIRHLVEIATRALSPGINDTYTALTVIDYLSQAMAQLFENEIPIEWYKDSNDNARLKVERIDEKEIILVAFNQIRNEGKSKPIVLKHLLKKLDILIDLAQTDLQKKALSVLFEDISLNVDKLEDQSSEKQYLQNLVKKIKAD